MEALRRAVCSTRSIAPPVLAESTTVSVHPMISSWPSSHPSILRTLPRCRPGPWDTLGWPAALLNPQGHGSSCFPLKEGHRTTKSRGRIWFVLHFLTFVNILFQTSSQLGVGRYIVFALESSFRDIREDLVSISVSVFSISRNIAENSFLFSAFPGTLSKSCFCISCNFLFFFPVFFVFFPVF